MEYLVINKIYLVLLNLPLEKFEERKFESLTEIL